MIVKDANNCTTSSLAVTIAQPTAALTITAISSNTPVCSGNTLNLSSTVSGGTSPYSYSWSGPNSFTSTSQNPSITNVTIVASGTYSLTVTDANGCSKTSTISVVINPLPVPTISGPSSACAGSTGNIYSTQALMSGYVWSVSAGGTITGGAGTNSITVTWNSWIYIQ